MRPLIPLVCGLLGMAASCGPKDERAAGMSTIALDELIGELPHGDARPAQGGDPASTELARRLGAGVQLTSEQWERLLLSTGVLRLRSRWPADEPFAVSMRCGAWLGDHVLVLVPQETDLQPILVNEPLPDCGTVALPEIVGWAYQELGRLPVGEQILPLRVELRSGQVRRDVVTTGELRIGIEIVATLDAALPPLATADVNADVGRTLSLAFERGRAVLIAHGELESPRLAHVARVLDVEVCEDSRVRERAKMRVTDNGAFGRMQDSRTELSCMREWLAEDPAERRRWTVRVRGSDDGILQSWGCDRRWTGEIVLSVDELLERGEALGR